MQDAVSLLDEDIDRKALRALRERFLALNAARLAALRERLAHDQRVFVDALPVLLHSNHAALPGFVDFDVAAGIEGYVPDRHAVAAVRTFALSFAHERFVERKHDLLAVYLAAPTRSGDAVALALSVCCARALHEGLEQKLAGIARFAADRGIALTPTLIDPDAQTFRSSRRSQHLARDAFYRSAILLAGRYPIWWLVPPELEDRHAAYCARLKAQRFIGRDETIDLGPAERIPRDECIDAGVDALERAIAAPYANLHTSMLLEAYATDAIEPLARRYKRSVWSAAAAVDDAGLAHEPVAEHLTRIGAGERLDLARQCLLACTVEPARQRELAAAWGWDDARIRRARADRELTIAELDDENRRVNAELAHQYAFLATHRDALDESSRARLVAIGDRIDRLARRPFGALTRVNAALLPRRIAGTVRVEFDDGQWRAFDGRRVAFAASRLAAVMTWAHLNRMTLDNIRAPDSNRRIACGRMLDLLSAAATAPAYRAWLVNAQETAMALQASHGDAIISDWDDALDFSGFHANLVAGIDVVDVGPDGARVAHHVGDGGLVDALLGVAAEPNGVPRIGCVAGGHERGVEERLSALVGELCAAFAERDRLVRFVLALADGYAVVERGPRGVRAQTVANDAALYDLLAAPPPRGQALVVDSRNPRLAALRQMCALRAADSAERECVLVHDQRGAVRVLVSTQDGSIHRVVPPDLPAHDVADSIAAYLAAHFAASSAANAAANAAAKRDRSARLVVARGDAAPTTVLAANVADGRYVTAIAPAIARRGLVHALREKFAIERGALA